MFLLIKAGPAAAGLHIAQLPVKLALSSLSLVLFVVCSFFMYASCKSLLFDVASTCVSFLTLPRHLLFFT
jgi:hypothetical protein